jgi:hypothetical protein
MDSATVFTQPDRRGTASHAPDSLTSDIVVRKRQWALDQLAICRDAIAQVDTADKDSWKTIIRELLEGGFEESVLETELAASRNTIYKWRTGVAAPREMTRRLLRKAILEMVDERIAAERDTA